MKIFYRLLGLVLLAFSLLILFSEAALVFSSGDEVLALSKMVKGTGQDSLFLLIVVLIIACLAYLVFCAYFSLFRMEIGITFELTVHQTHAITMMKSATTCLNLAFPLCYNLMMLFSEVSPSIVQGHEYSSAFADFFVPMRTVPFFGDNYNTIVPLFIALIGFFTAFKFFGRLVARATKGLIAIEVAENTPEKIAKGEKAVLGEWERRKRKLRQDEINVQRTERIQSSQAIAQKPKEEKKEKKEEIRSESASVSMISQDKTKEKMLPYEQKEINDIESNPVLTNEQKAEIIQQERIAKDIQDIGKDLEIASVNKEEKSDFDEVKGYLGKKGMLGQWKDWYFCVLGNSLCFYDNNKLGKKEGEFEIEKIKSVGVLPSKKKKNQGKKIVVNIEKGQIILKAKNSEEAQKWVAYLNYVVQMYQINKI